MTEREKMLACEQYNPFDTELGEMALRARRSVAAYCAADAAHRDERTRLLREVFAQVGRGTHVEPPFFADFGVHTTIGEHTFINVNAVILDNAAIGIGNRCLLGPAVQLITVMHPLRAVDRRTPDAEIAAGQCPARTMTAPVTIGDDVWLGAGVIVLPGVTIGDRCTIGAGSVVTTDIPPDSLALGTPAKVVRDLS